MEEFYDYGFLYDDSFWEVEKVMQAFHSSSMSPPTPDNHAVHPIEVPSSPSAQPFSSHHVDAEFGATVSLPPHLDYTPHINSCNDGGDNEVIQIPQPQSQPPPSNSEAQERDALKATLDRHSALFSQTHGSLTKLDISNITNSMSQPALKGIQEESTNDGSSNERLGDRSKEKLEITKSTDLDDEKHERRKVANRDSARRCRQKKEDKFIDLKAKVASLQEQVASLQAQNSKLSLQYSELSLRHSELKDENSKLLDCLVSRNENDANVKYQCLKADIQNLTDEVVMLRKEVLKTNSISSGTKDISISTMPSSTRPYERNSNNEAILIPGDSRCFAETLMDKETMNSGFPMPVRNTLHEEDISNVTNGKGKLGRSESMLRVASLEHIKKRACSGCNKFDEE